jgi:hypothetical protein
VRWFVDRPADRLLADRVEILSGWIEAGERPFALRLVCGRRELAVRPCPHPAARHEPGARGFWSFLFLQDLLDEVRPGERLEVHLLWEERPMAILDLRLLPTARELATRFPISRRRHAVPPGARAEAAPASGAGETVVFPGLGGVGGSSVNQLVRHELFARGAALPVYSEADSPGVWARLCAAPPPFRWIDGHACFDAARALGRRPRRFTLLREPLARLASVVNYGSLVHPRDFPCTDLGELAASGEARRLSMAAGLLRCAGIPWRRDMPDRDLHSLAREQLEREYALVGITELFEETIFLLCGPLDLDSVGLWWRVLSAPSALVPDALPAATRTALERALAVDLALYEEARRAFAARVARAGIGAALDAYRSDAARQPELPALLKTLECLRWRQVLAESELGAVTGRPAGFGKMSKAECGHA